MKTITISRRFQIVIPRDVRRALALRPGQKLQALAYENRIEFIPIWALKKARGFLTGIHTSVKRDRDRV